MSFKSCPRVGGISTSPSFFLGASGFQVVPPCGGHLLVCSQHSRDSIVSSRAPVWGASVATDPNWEIREVSSRAPVWGASFVILMRPSLSKVSSRAPVWGASFSVPCSGACWEFQVVPPCGGHLQIEAIRYTRIRSFKSCPRVGGIFLTRKYVNPYKLFQVVPPCGGHPAVLSGFFVLWILVSSRAPVWGASFLLCFFGFIPFSVSSRAPVWGASFFFAFLALFHFLFQAVPPCGGHPHYFNSHSCPIRFKSCPRVGGINQPPLGHAATLVSSRAPVWGASPPAPGHLPSPLFQVVPPCGGHRSN